MSNLGEYVNNRELASLSLVFLLMIAGVAMRSTRPLLGSLLRLFFFSSIGLAFALYATVISSAIYGMSQLGLWTKSLFGSSLLWFFLVGLVWFFNLTEAAKDSDFFKRRLIATLGISAALEAFVGLAVLPLWAEFVVQVLLGVVVLVNSFATTDLKYRPAAQVTAGLLTTAGAGTLVYTFVKFITQWQTQNWQDVLNQFLLPLWLTTAALPVLYLIALTIGYESLFKHMSFWNDRRRPKLSALVGVTLELRGKLVLINQYRGPSVAAAACANKIGVARGAVKTWSQARAEEASRRTAARQRLESNAGAQGQDTDGLELDRREFAATKAALKWIANCHMGWYQQEGRPNSYREDILIMLGDFDRQGLPQPHGISMNVRKDGQAYFAYRRTISGFVLGIGASEQPPSLWSWQSRELPSRFPSERSGWTPDHAMTDSEWKEEDPI